LEDSKTILEIERLVKAQDDVSLTANSIQLVNGTKLDYRINSGPNGRTLGDIIKPPANDQLKVSTLTGFIDAFNAGIIPESVKADQLIVHVEDYLTVSLRAAACDLYGDRETLLVAKHTPIDAFKFDAFYSDPAKFIIGLQVAFLQTEELLWLIKVASNLKAGNTVAVEDDGFSQTVTLKAGEVSTAEVKVKPRIKLVPIRTFTEAPEVESEFLIRFQQTPQQTPSIALFNVDGTKWQGDTMRAIKTYLEKNLPKGTPILA
jgi:hypothetical protein